MFFKIIKILFCQKGGLGITQASIVSAVADGTGDDSADAVVKIKRLINEVGPDFCNITNWPFLRNDFTFSIGTTDYKYSGSDVLPETFKKFIAKPFILYNQRRYPIEEVGIGRSKEWQDPNENEGIPFEFCVTRPEDNYYEIQFNRLPDRTYTVYCEAEFQWSNLTTTTSETVVTKQYYTGFCHFVKMARLVQQGDTEILQIAKNDWYNPMTKQGIYTRMLKTLKRVAGRKNVKVDSRYLDPLFQRNSNDYDKRGWYV